MSDFHPLRPPALTRRQLLTASSMCALGWYAARLRADPALTARDIVSRIRQRCEAEGVTWLDETVDTFKAGNPDTPVTSVVVTFMATLDVLRRANASGANFVISHEPIWWDHFDDPGELRDDPVYLAKRDFIEKNGMVVWRFHDHWHRLKPEPMSTALVQRLGWEHCQQAGTGGFRRRFTRPPMRLDQLVRELAATLPTRSIRVIGNPQLTVSDIAMVGHELRGVIPMLDQADVFIAPEIIEWDTAEFFRDIVEQGEPRALILLAHERGEEEGMDRCDEWLRGFVTEVPVRFLSTGEPFWNLEATS